MMDGQEGSVAGAEGVQTQHGPTEVGGKVMGSMVVTEAGQGLTWEVSEVGVGEAQVGAGVTVAGHLMCRGRMAMGGIRGMAEGMGLRRAVGACQTTRDWE